MKNIRTTLKLMVIIALILTKATAHSQKLPTVQKTSVQAPANIKIDGKANEWDDTYQAHSNAIELSYTIANNIDNLYLVMHATENTTIQKIAAGGITITINNAVKKSGAIPVIITYPHMSFYGQGSTGMILRGKTTDAELVTMNKNFTDNTKELPITGIKEITDNFISIYNDMGIKAAQFVDGNKAYTIEIALPLKYLKDVIDAHGTFNYKIQVNGMQSRPGSIIIGGTNLSPSDAPVTADSGNYIFAPTYLVGTYKLF